MLQTTIDIIRTGLRADPTLSPAHRASLLTLLKTGGEGPTKPEPPKPTAPRIVRRREAAQIYGCSLRLIDRLAAQGVLRRVRLPGRQRGAGFIETDLLAVIGGK